MVFRRFRRRRFPAYPRRRRFMVRRPRRVMRRRLNKTNLHHFVRWEPQDDPTIVDCNFGSAGTNPLSLTFSLDKVVNPNEFTSLYDQYKIKGIKIYFDYSPDVVMTGAVNASTALMPKLWLKRDYDDASTATLTQMTESNQSRCIRFNANRNTFSIFLRPATLKTIYRTSLTSAYGPQWNEWLDCQNNDIPHYGLKLLAQGAPSVNLGAITVRCKYYLAFKNVR